MLPAGGALGRGMPGDAGLCLGAGLRQPGQRPRGRGSETGGCPGGGQRGRQRPRPSLPAAARPGPAAGQRQRAQADLRQGIRHARHRDQVRAAAVHRGAFVSALQLPDDAQERVPQQRHYH